MRRIKGKKRPYIGYILLAFLMLSTPSFAANYNLQPYTSCALFNSTHTACLTVVNVSSLGLSTAKINALKAINITNFLNKSGAIGSFSYSWNGNVVSLTGLVNSNVYWNFGSGGDTFDPWWNVSGTNAAGNNSYDGTFSSGGNYASLFGITVKPVVDGVNLTWAAIDGVVTCQWINVYNFNTSTDLGNFTITASNTTFNGTTITTVKNDFYMLALHNKGASCAIRYDSPTDNALPDTTSAQLYIVGGAVDKTFQATQINNVVNVGYVYVTAGTSTYYTDNLFLNGVEGNITIGSTTNLNATATTNLTNTGVTIFINGVNSSFGANFTSNVSLLPIGVYNVTAFIGNSSTNDTITRWATVADQTAPTWSNLGANDTNPDPNDNVTFFAKWNDNVALSHHIFSWNGTGGGCGTWANDSAVAFAGGNWSNVTKTEPPSCAEKTIAFKFYANDSSNNWNVTTQEIIIENAFDSLTSLSINGFAANATLDNASLVNLSASVDVGGNVSIFTNGTLRNDSINATWSGYLSEGMWNITAAFAGNGSYEFSSATFWANMTFNAPPNNTATGQIIWDIAAMEPSNVYCFNTSYKAQVYAEPNITRLIFCPNDCDTTNNSCNPPKYQQYLLIFGGIALLVVILWRAVK